MIKGQIIISTTLAADDTVMAMAHATGLTAHEVVGHLVAVWSWFNTHADGVTVTGPTMSDVDADLDTPGFLEVMERMAWLKASVNQTGGLVLTLTTPERHRRVG